MRRGGQLAEMMHGKDHRPAGHDQTMNREMAINPHFNQISGCPCIDEDLHMRLCLAFSAWRRGSSLPPSRTVNLPAQRSTNERAALVCGAMEACNESSTRFERLVPRWWARSLARTIRSRSMVTVIRSFMGVFCRKGCRAATAGNEPGERRFSARFLSSFRSLRLSLSASPRLRVNLFSFQWPTCAQSKPLRKGKPCLTRSPRRRGGWDRRH
jgi:hypothetical protein